MRFAIAGLILALTLPVAQAKGRVDKGQCKDRCGSNYQFCLSRARTKQARASCKADRKTCKSSCSH